eukprot:1161684-Pelagomonas_calceolata.AAC.6
MKSCAACMSGARALGLTTSHYPFHFISMARSTGVLRAHAHLAHHAICILYYFTLLRPFPIVSMPVSSLVRHTSFCNPRRRRVSPTAPLDMPLAQGHLGAHFWLRHTSQVCSLGWHGRQAACRRALAQTGVAIVVGGTIVMCPGTRPCCYLWAVQEALPCGLLDFSPRGGTGIAVKDAACPGDAAGCDCATLQGPLEQRVIKWSGTPS